MHFGEPVAEDRLAELLRPGDGIETVITADVYGAGAADELLGRALAGLDRDSYSLVGAVGHDFYEGERDGPRGFPRFTDPRLRGPDGYASYLRMATERSLERLGERQSRPAAAPQPRPHRLHLGGGLGRYGRASRRRPDAAIGVAPGPANGFTLDLIDCFERFGERIDWAMVILNPLEPWPGELCLDAAAKHEIRRDHAGGRLRRAVLGRRPPRPRVRRARPSPLPARGLGRGRARAARAHAADRRARRADPDAARLPVEPRPCGGRLRRADADPGGRRRRADDRGQAGRARGAPAERRLSEADVAEIRAIGDNFGSMALKGASPDHEGEERPDRWS